MADATRITVRRTVPFDLDDVGSGALGLRLTINDMHADPDRAALVVVGPGVADRTTVGVGDEVVLAGRPWLVEQIVVGDRGSVNLVGLDG